MENIICNVTEEDILKVELYCDLGESNLIEDIKNNKEVFKGKTQILMECYFTIIALMKGYDKNLNLECLRIVTTDYDTYQIFSKDMRKNDITVSSNFVKMMISVTNYLCKQETLNVKVLDYSTFDYVDYTSEEKTNKKGR